MLSIASLWIWIGFGVFLVFALSLDTFLVGKNRARPYASARASLQWTLIWVASALIFNGLLWVYLFTTASPTVANHKALEFFTGYLIEKTLSIDNLFAFYMVFQHFRIPAPYQHRIFSIGIWSAIILRLILILMGVYLVNKFHWVLYIMGIFLLLTGIKMCLVQEKEKDLSETLTIKLLKRVMRLTTEIRDQQFFIRKNGLLYATPLFVAVIFIEMSDLIFAFDSIPAIFGITRDPFIIWSSNIFAILGLRALYFLLVNLVHRFHLLKYGVAFILVFVGCKMLVEPWVHVSVLCSLGVIVGILGLFTGLSVWHRRYQGR